MWDRWSRDWAQSKKDALEKTRFGPAARLSFWRAALFRGVLLGRSGTRPTSQVPLSDPARVLLSGFAVTSREGALLWAIPPGDGAPLAPANSGLNSVPEPPRHLPPEP